MAKLELSNIPTGYARLLATLKPASECSDKELMERIAGTPISGPQPKTRKMDLRPIPKEELDPNHPFHTIALKMMEMK